MSEPWISENWHTSLLNFQPEALAGLGFPPKIELSDCTLREGEQQPGIVLGVEEKIAIAEALEGIGIPQIEAGMPAVSELERKAVSEVVKRAKKAKISVVCRALKGDIDMAVDCGAWGMNLSLPVGYLQVEYKLKWPEQRVIDTAVTISNYAHEKGLYVIFSPYDTTRIRLDFFQRFLAAVTRDGHGDRIRLVDTSGAVSPEGARFLVRLVKGVSSLPVEIHCHNDFGLATANTLAALAEGASVASTSMNGMGERAGGAPTEEVAAALEMLYGIRTGIQMDGLYRVSRMVQELSKLKVQVHKPVVGDNAFAQEAGLVVAGFVEEPFTAQSYRPEFVGQRNRIILGKASGKESIRLKLSDLGIEPTDRLVDRLLLEVKHLAEERKTFVPDEDFAEMARRAASEG